MWSNFGVITSVIGYKEKAVLYIPVCIAWVGETVDGNAGLRGVEDFPYPVVKFVVGNPAPEGRLAKHHRLRVDERRRRNGDALRTIRLVFYCTWLGTHASTMSQDVTDTIITRGFDIEAVSSSTGLFDALSPAAPKTLPKREGPFSMK